MLQNAQDFKSPDDDKIDAEREIVRSDPLYVWHISEHWIVVRNHAGSFNSTHLPVAGIRSIEWIGAKKAKLLCPWGDPPTPGR